MQPVAHSCHERAARAQILLKTLESIYARRQIATEFAWIGFGQGIAALGGLFGVRLLTGAMSPALYGQFALALTVTTLIGQIVLGPASQVAIRYYSSAIEHSEFGQYAGALGWLTRWGIGIVAAFFAAFAILLVAGGAHEWLWLGSLSFLFALIQGLIGIFDGIQNAARNRILVACHLGLATWLRILLAFGLVRFLGANSSHAMLGYLAGGLIILASEAYFFYRRIYTVHAPVARPASSRTNWKGRTLEYFWPFATWGIFSFMQQSSDRWALGLTASTAAVGVYAALYQLSFLPVTMAANVAVQLLEPIVYRRAGDGSDHARMSSAFRLIRRMIVLSISATAIAGALAVILHRPIFGLLVAPGYRQVAPLMPVMVAAGGLFATGQVASISLMSTGKSRLLLAPKVGTSILGAALNLIGARTFGIVGVVAGQLLFALVYLAWVLGLSYSLGASRGQ